MNDKKVRSNRKSFTSTIRNEGGKAVHDLVLLAISSKNKFTKLLKWFDDFNV